MTNSILQELENLSLLLVLQDPGDLQGFGMLEQVFASIGAEASNVPALAPIAAACTYVADSSKSMPKSDLLKIMNECISQFQAFLRDSSQTITVGKSGTSSWGKDLASNFDQELCIECVEKHTLGLDELESQLMSVVSSADCPPVEVLNEVHGAVKAYLHTLKGDAGSVGFNGIERATHTIEDLFALRQAHELVDELLTFREWVLTCFKAFCTQQTPSINAAQFMESLTPSSVESTPTSSASTPPAASSPVKTETYKLEGEADILVEFIAEAEDHLSALEEKLLSREASHVAREDLDFVFRAVHSLKGGSAYFCITETTRSSHLLENLLDRTRNGSVTFDETLYRICLSYVDVQRDILNRVKAGLGKDEALTFAAETSSLILRIEQFNANLSGTIPTVQTPGAPAEKLPSPKTPTVAPSTSAAPQANTKAAEIPLQGKSDFKPGGKPSEVSEVKSFVKVDTQRLDLLIEYIGEMVISSSMLIQANRNLLPGNESIVNNCHQLEQITREIQSIGMSMRLVPIKGLFQKMGRLVWDTSKKLGKDVTFKMDGEDTELDRTVIERIADPLMHMVRNSLDHGLEGPDDRVAKGKARSGVIELSAYHSGGAVFVRIKDDGRGLNQEVIVRKAIEKGIVAPDAKLEEHEIFQLIFAPGFSTAAVVTDISGRGVGMDVVKRNIEEMRGRIHIESTPGQGSVFTVELPLTLAIMDGIAAVVGSERLIVPALSVIEFVRPTQSMITHTLDRGETLSFRGRYLPIFRIGNLFGISDQRERIEDCIVMVVEGNAEQVALVVDDVVGKLPAVIKSLGSMFRHVKGLAGCAVMPDGGVGLIVDVNTLVELARSEKHQYHNSSATHAELRVH